MPNGKYVPLSQMEVGQSGIVVQIQGGQGMINRLNALSIRPGKIPSDNALHNSH